MEQDKMNRIIIVGGGGHAKVLISVLKKTGSYELVGYTDMRDAGELLGVPYLGTDSVLEEKIKAIVDCCAAWVSAR